LSTEKFVLVKINSPVQAEGSPDTAGSW